MTHLGHIESNAGGPINMDDWIRKIECENRLVNYPSREVRNPATGETVWAGPPKSSVQYVLNDIKHGDFSVSPDESGFVLVAAETGYEQEVISFACELATMLEGRFVSQNESQI